ncbi:MAG: hypothetical protein J6V75_01510 [Bacteroidaceae bacterium]|nr:hypothetical protein [Bacteroidaceae bacterium]MBP5348160.1 hypothetical protein [Bacteroidaceae bacterium]
MTAHSAIKTVLLLLVATLLSAPVRSQDTVSIRSALVDSLYRSLNDTAAWNNQLEFVRNITFDQVNDSDLVRVQEEMIVLEQPRLKWRDKERMELDRLEREITAWEPDPRKAVWLSLLIPGGGQIYNHKYWKLPIVYGGFVGCIYALTWNQSTYTDYQNAYVDIMDDDPNTKSYEDFLPPHYEIDTSMMDWLKEVFRQRKDKYRRYRDLSIFAFMGMYLVATIDAYVDAELSHFDISPNLSMTVEPNLMIDHRGAPTAGFSLAFNF